MPVAGAWSCGGEGQDLQRRDHGQSVCQNGGHESMFKKEGTNDPKAGTEACVKMGGKYVLFDGASKAVYQLDDQTKPKSFAGQKVQITGDLDKATKTIHVTEIKAAS
jgi:hypothetical protein